MTTNNKAEQVVVYPVIALSNRHNIFRSHEHE
jgi:hypothetical protein